MQSFFVSSTFKDMQGERDALHRTVMPRLRERAVANGENIQFVDLRWGISTSDMDSKDSTSKILSVCLREVNSCKPYMIVLLGQRYGWIPPVEQIREAGALVDFTPEDMNISVTELEIRFGMYAANGQLDRCFFCLRDPLEEAALTPEQKEVYLPANDEDARRMAALREKIRNTPGAQVITYRLECDNGQLTGYEDFAEKLYAALEDKLVFQWVINQKYRSWQQRQREEDAITAENHLRCFVERQDTLQQVVDAIRYTQVVMLEGEGGCGKSALMSKLNQKYREAGYQSSVFFCGTSSGCMTVQQLMRLMIWQLESIRGTVFPDVEDALLQEHFREQMERYDGPMCIFFVDAIDQLAPDQDLFESRFLPPVMSGHIRLILSTTGAVRVDPTALTGYTFRKIRLEPPGEAELRSILHSRFASEHKQISQKVADKILENPCSKNMLGMEIMVRRLVMLGQKDFTEISRLEQTMGGAEAIDTYLLQLIEGLSTDLNQLIITYFEAVCRFLNGEDYAHSAMLLYLIGIMQHGISPQELEDFSQLLHTDETFAQIPKDSPWMHFWNPISFAQLKRFMGGLLVERSNGNVDLSHRLLRQAMRSVDTFSIIAPVLRCWLIKLPNENNQKLENILPVCRMAEECNRRTNQGKEYTEQGDLITYFFCNPIRDAGRLDDSGDPEGARQLAILERSVIQDITGQDQKAAAASYCTILEFLIRGGAHADHYTIWFFGSRIAVSLSRLGQAEKAGALRLMSCILSNLHKEKDIFEAGARQFWQNWTTQRKRRFLYYHCHTLQKMADLRIDFRLGNVEVQYFDGMSPKVVFEKGCALADECIREDPTYALFHLRKAALYAAYAQQTAEGANLGISKSPQQLYTEQAFECIQKAFRIQVTDFFMEYALYIIAICIEAIHMEGSGRLFGSKKALTFGMEMCRKTWDLVTASGDLQKVPVECVARFKLAWSRCLDARGDLLLCRDPSPWQQQSLELCAEYYLQIRSQKERVLSQPDRKYLGLVGVQACMMMLYGNVSKAMTDAGYLRTAAIGYIAKQEAGYFRAEARRDFESRWCWALMLCAECYSGTLKPQAGLETANRAISLLEELQQSIDRKGYAVNISTFRIQNFRNLAERLRDQYAKLVETVSP